MKLSSFIQIRDGLVILFGTIVHCSKNVTKVTIPAYVNKIGKRAFKNCKWLKEIRCESGAFVSKNGCLYSEKGKELITTVSGEVTVPQEVKKLRRYSYQNCTAILFESGGSITKMPKSEGNRNNEVFETIQNEVNKNNAKESKMKEILFASIDALLKSVSAANNIEIKQFRDQNSYVLSVPIGDGGVEIDLSNVDIMQIKGALSDLFKLISDGAGVWAAVDYCKAHNLPIPMIGIKYDVILRGTKKINKTFPGYLQNYYFGVILDERSIESVAIPATVKKIGKNAFFNYQCLSNFVFDGTTSQWHKIKKAKGWYELAEPSVVHCTDGDVMMDSNEV